MTIEAGQQLLHYRLVEKIGQGGMGVVWRAVDTTLDREVAIKLLPEDLAQDPERLARFEREAKALASLDHPNIVTIHSVQQAHGLRFITMELVRGTPLAKAIPETGLAPEELLRVSIALAGALGAAHEKGVIHRDLKPANVMIGADGRVRVLDFGLVKRSRSEPRDEADLTRTATATRFGQVVGTLPYMSPEQLKGEQVDQRTDIFSLGVSICQMALGHHPFPAKSDAELVASILTASPPSVSGLRPGIPAELDRIIRRCMEKDPERRYPSALELRAELVDLERRLAPETAVAGTRPVASPTAPELAGSAEPPVKRRSRKARRDAAWVVMGGVVTTVAGLALMPWLYVLVPEEPVWPVGAIPLLVGIVLMAWGRMSMRS